MLDIKKFDFGASSGWARSDRDASALGTLWLIGASLAVLASMLLPGCSSSSGAHAVDSPQARDALKIALDTWKRGDTPRSLDAGSTPMIVQDMEWASGVKLVDYELVDDGKPEDANLRVRVKLTTSGGQKSGIAQAKPAEKKVWYLVTTSPRITVFRDMLRR